ncbi:MAG: ATP-binding protein [Halopseudomonas sp.]
MRSLYLKVFLAFWLVMMLVVGSNMMLTWMLARQFEDAEVRNRYVETYAQQALDSYLDGGTKALNDWRQQLFNKKELRVLLLDSQGRNLNGEPLSPRLNALIRRSNPAMMPPADFGSPRQHRPGRHLRPIVWPIQHQQSNYLFVMLNPHELLDHLYSGGTLVWRLALSVLLVGLLSFLMARYLIQPIRQLQQASRQLAGGELSTRVPPPVSNRRDELGQLGEDFNQMAERIQNLVQGQQQLLRDVSHELRTPLARQRFALELARKKPDSTEALDRIEQQAEELDALIGEILMLARLDNSATQAPHTSTDLDPLLQALTAEFNFDQERLHYQSCGTVTLNTDPRLIHRAVSNIVGNALKYSQAEVQLILEQDAQAVSIRVLDQGPGIDATMLEKIFEPFVRTDQARSRQQGGWGLGLAIAARAVHQHQGQISASNLQPHGLEVSIRLPLTT